MEKPQDVAQRIHSVRDGANSGKNAPQPTSEGAWDWPGALWNGDYKPHFTPPDHRVLLMVGVDETTVRPEDTELVMTGDASIEYIP